MQGVGVAMILCEELKWGEARTRWSFSLDDPNVAFPSTAEVLRAWQAIRPCLEIEVARPSDSVVHIDLPNDVSPGERALFIKKMRRRLVDTEGTE